MTSPSEADRARAAELAAKAREHEERLEWVEAHDLYKQSLALHHDDEVKAAYQRVRATIYPM
jgi:hypothetical protein